MSDTEKHNETTNIIAVPQWQKDEVLKRKELYQQHPEELIGWEEALKMLNAE